MLNRIRGRWFLVSGLYSKTNKFELNIILKAHFFFVDGVAFGPGISVGLGFSSDLNKWVVRPEFGYEGYASFGIGINFILTNMLKTK